VRRAASARLLCAVRDGQDRGGCHGAAGGVSCAPPQVAVAVAASPAMPK
jgi:hypothetical protein